MAQPQVNSAHGQKNVGRVPEQHSLSEIGIGHPAQNLAEHAKQVTDWLRDLSGVQNDRAMRKLAVFSIGWAAEDMEYETGIPVEWETFQDATDLLVARGWTILRTREEAAAKRRGKYDFYGED